MKSPLIRRLPLLAAGCLLVASARGQASVSLSVTEPANGASVLNGEAVPVKVTAAPSGGATVTGANLVYRTLAAGSQTWWNTNGMTAIGGNVYSGLVARLSSGPVEYYVDCFYTGAGATSPARSATRSYTNAAIVLDGIDLVGAQDARATDFADWASVGTDLWQKSLPGGLQWYAAACGIGNIAGLKPPGWITPFLYMKGGSGTYVLSPKLDGIGTVFFSASMRYTYQGTTLSVQISTNTTPSGWSTVRTFVIPNGGILTDPIVINRADARYLRFVRESSDSNYLFLDNVVISPLPAEAIPAASVPPVEPPAPSSGQSVTLRCQLSNRYNQSPAINRRVSAYFKWSTSPWQSVSMTSTDGWQYEGQLPGLEAGTVQYYFVADFDGYSLSYDPDGMATNQATRNTSLSPRVSTTNSYAVSFAATKVIGLNGSLIFGDVATNATALSDVTVTNSGNTPLFISSVLTPTGFTASPLSFTVSPGGSTNVTVRFAPPAAVTYTGSVVFVSDKTSGNDTLPASGTGVAVETVSKPLVSGPASSTRTGTGSYSASAANNYGHTVEYQFAWGDGTTSAWSTVAASKTWNSAGTFQVQAQGRCQPHPTVVSAWSDPLTVTVTNTRVIVLGGESLAFGSYPINTVNTRSMTVANTGVSDLHVTSITSSSARFTAQPQSFTVVPGGVSNVTVTFNPTAVTSYSGTLTVNSDKTSGFHTQAVSGSGTAQESVSLLSFTGPGFANTGDTVTYSVTASNNYGNSLAYRFAWGDGTTSAWSTANSASRTYAAAGLYTIRGQAGSPSPTPSILSALSTGITVRVVAPPDVSFGSAQSGIPIPVTVTIPSANGTVTSCTLHYRAPGSELVTFESLVLSWNGSAWTGSLVPLNPGTLSYYITYTVSGVSQAIRYPLTGSVTWTIAGDATTLGQRRYADFMSWTSAGGNVYYKDVPGGSTEDRWSAIGALVGSTSGDKPSGGANPWLYLRSIEGAYVLSPMLSEGVGTIYFSSVIKSTRQSGTVEVQVSTNTGPTAVWQTVRTISYPYTATLPLPQRATPVELNRRDVRRVRFIRTAGSPTDTSETLIDGAVVFDNIAFSPPPADVTITERLRNPGYPSQDQDIKVRCVVQDINPLAPTVNRNVTVRYQWQSTAAGGWTNMVPMVHLGGNLYEGTIPKQQPGVLYYYFQCDFDGYYFQLDPDGTGTQPTNSENQSPTFLPDIDEDGAVRPDSYLSFPVRPYRSSFNSLSVEADPASLSVPMDLVGDNIWQGITLVKGVTNMTWVFRGFGEYTNDATAFNPVAKNWGDNDQDFPFPPISGYVEASATNTMRAELEYEGFLLLRVNTSNRDYIVKRAVYQNFDNWQASATHFEESLGLYAVKSFTNSFNTWAADGYTLDKHASENFSNDGVASTYQRVPTLTANNWVYNQAMVIAGRRFDSVTAPNNAVMLDPVGAGTLGNTGRSLTEGVETFTFRARASINDNNLALYKNGTGWTLPQTVTTTMRAAEYADSKAYLSVIVCYQPEFLSLGSFYQVRVVQESDTGTGDNQSQLQVWRWSAGAAPVQIARYTTSGLSENYDSTLNTEKTYTITVTDAGTYTEVKVGVSGRTGADPYTYFRDTNLSSRLTVGGTVGYLSYDAVPLIKDLTVDGGRLSVSDFTLITASQWYFGGKRNDDPAKDRWTVDSSTKLLTRVVPRQTLAIYRGDVVADEMVPDFTAMSAKNPAVYVQSLTYTNVTETFKTWRKTFVDVRYTVGDVPVVLDDTRLKPWRGVTRSFSNTGTPSTAGVQYYDWTSWDAHQFPWTVGQKGWVVLEGWVTNSAGSVGNEVQLERTRANPDLVQALVSPVLTNGIGSIAFEYRVSGGQAVYAIERSIQGTEQNWVALDVITNNAGAVGSYYLPVRELFEGRLRVRMLPASNANAMLKLDQLFVRDYPPRDDTTWQAYNALITNLETTRAFEPTRLDHQTAYLNNHPKNGVAGAEVLDEHLPFIQTPKVGTGIGEIAFWYRVWTPGLTGTLVLKVAPDPDVPEASWTTLTNLTVSSSTYQYFRTEPYDMENKVLRIYCLTNGSDRVAIDNVLMTEPVRSGYEIRTVHLDPVQPLEGEPVQVEVEIGRFIMNPTGIKLYLSYHAGDSVWGYTNWWTQTHTTGSQRIELTQVADKRYRTPTGIRIPGGSVDSIIQYVIWGTHDTLTGKPIFQGTNTFANPLWYAPRNLNTEKAAQGWSPYYFVYSCPPGSVWLNEVNYKRVTDESTTEYIELLGPAEALLGGWRIDLISYSDYTVTDFCSIEDGFRIQNATNGWGFFVWGDVGVPGVNQTFAIPLGQNIPQNGGVRLVRSMGAIEQRVCYGASAYGMTNNLYQHIGTKSSFRTAPLHLESRTGTPGSQYSDFYWIQPNSGLYSPGNVNKDQFLEEIMPLEPTVAAILSVIGPNGVQNSVAVPLLSFEVQSGGSTSIVYTADNWYRIASFVTNGVPVPEAVGAPEFAWTLASAVGGATYSNNVTFAEATPVQTGYPSGIPTSWLAQFGPEGFTQDTDSMGLEEEYLLDTDPTTNESKAFAIESVSVSGGDVQVVVRLLIDDAPHRTINGTLRLKTCDNIASPNWTVVADTDVTGLVFDAAGRKTYTFTDVTDPTLFCKAVIE